MTPELALRVLEPLFPEPYELATRARHLSFAACPPSHATALTRAWHSRLPVVQEGPWQFAFHAEYRGVTYAVALWNNPSGRCLPQHWLELRRLACAPDAPPYTASRFLGWMARYFRKHHPEREALISYQDTAVHEGTIYKAAGWVAAYTSKPRQRDRSGKRAGTDRMYRWNVNGDEPDASAKVRWEKRIGAKR